MLKEWYNSGDDYILEILENNKEEIMSDFYPANKIWDLMIDYNIPLCKATKEVAEQWLIENDILYNERNFWEGYNE
ncbi:MAG: hypothetical protein ACQEQF_00025 [Bacillota bacterium]